MTMPSEKEMQKAVANRDKSSDGQFFYGVITTGIFCKPSCSSRAAKLENLRFFPNTTSAMEGGFRPCKTCKPTGENTQTGRLIEVARYIEQHADEKLTLARLAEVASVSASRLQRTFKQAFGLSPKIYQDAIRMKLYKQSLQQGEGITDAILSSGYGSISRVYGEATRNIGMKPKAYRAGGEGETITYASRNTSLGLMMMAVTGIGVCFVQFEEDEASLFSLLKGEFPKAELLASTAQNAPDLDNWMEALEQHIGAGAARPDLPLDMRGTAFQMQVWRFLLSVPEGDVLSYTEVANAIDKPKAIRAAASACGKNRIGVLIPCHRVIRGDGGLGGYRWGLERKRALLNREREVLNKD